MSKNHKQASEVRLPRTPRPHFTFVVDSDQEIKLLDFLVGIALKDRSRTTVKQLLHDRFISVNDVPTTQFDLPLKAGDRVVLHPAPLPAELRHPQVEILWQDDHLVMIHKSAGIPTVASGQERDQTAMQIVSAHLKKFNPRAKVYLLNRVDKDSAGFVLMAKTAEMQAEISEHWEQYVLVQTFAVAIEGLMKDPEGYLAPPRMSATSRQGKRIPSRLVQGADQAGLAHYRTVSTTPVGSLLVVELKSGRNNRLRKQFAALKTPILGDWRNGSKRTDLGRVGLETIAFGFVHPITGKRYDFDQPIPAELRQWLRQV